MFTDGKVKSQNAKSRHNTGSPSVQLTVGVGRTGVLMCGVCPRVWNAGAAVSMYEKLARDTRKALKLNANTRLLILEDNDPAGYKSGASKAAKARLGIDILQIPARRPDLSVMDYAIWNDIATRMNAENAKLARRKNYKETRDQYISRLQRTVNATDKKFVRKSIGDMVRRTNELVRRDGDNVDK